MSKHTPGPWKHEPSLARSFEINQDTDGKWSAVASCEENNLGSRPVSLEEAGCNARLIAAAPELLDAAEELKAAFMDGCGEATKGPKRARLVKAAAALDDAIAKAKGQQP